jgi:hypothetical protein
MNDTFDELTKRMAQSTTRREAMKKFSLGFAGIALAELGLANKAKADPQPCLPGGYQCGSTGMCKSRCCSGSYYSVWSDGKKYYNICN